MLSFAGKTKLLSMAYLTYLGVEDPDELTAAGWSGMLSAGGAASGVGEARQLAVDALMKRRGLPAVERAMSPLARFASRNLHCLNTAH